MNIYININILIVHMTSHVAQQIKFGRDTAVDYRYHFLVDIKW